MTHGLVVGVWACISPFQALVVKTSVFHIEFTYIIGNSESCEQWQRQTALGHSKQLDKNDYAKNADTRFDRPSKLVRL